MKKYDYLRPAENVVFAAKIWNGTTLYQIDGAPVFFGTKKDAAAYIRENFSGDAQKVRLYDLRNAGRLPRPWLNVLPAVAEDQNAVLRLRKCSRSNGTFIYNRGFGESGPLFYVPSVSGVLFIFALNKRQSNIITN